MEINQLISQCAWDTTSYLIFSENVFAPFIYYSHLFALVISLFVGFFVYTSNRKALSNNLLFLITIFLSIWIFGDLVLWATDKPAYTMAFWSVINLFEPFIYATSLYFLYVFIDKKDISLIQKFVIGSFLLPTIIFAYTNLNLLGYDLTNCDRAAIEGPLAQYGYIIEILFVLWMVFLAFNRYYKATKDDRKKIALVSIGLCFFLLSFSLGNITEVITENWYIGQIGLIGVPVFIGLLAYVVVKFGAFNIKLLASQALITSIGFLILSILFLRNIENVRIVILITLALFIVLGRSLIRSVKREVEAKEALTLANNRLRELDKQKSEFVSFATHQLRSPLTAIKGNTSLILEGDLGPISGQFKGVVETIYTSVKTMINVVEDYLNISRIELGTMKYTLVEMDFKELLKEIVNEQKPNIEAKGLSYSISVDEKEVYKIKADPDKFKQVVMNTIDNSIKYTKQGSIALSLEKDIARSVVRLKITDTGVGIAPDVIPKLFQKFTRAANANEANIHGTGLGLYIAKEIMNAHGGKIWAESAGEGRGSQFYIEVPLAK
jgi:signal transduction histidine kinase